MRGEAEGKADAILSKDGEFALLLFIFSAARNGILVMENLCNVPIRVIETRFPFFSFSLSLFHRDITIAETECQPRWMETNSCL